MRYYEIQVPAPLSYPLTYHYNGELLRGQKVHIALRNKPTWGVVHGETHKPEYKTQQVKEVSVEKIETSYLEWLEWIAEYYQYPKGLVINSVFPSLEKKENKKKEGEFVSEKFKLNKGQTEVLNQINNLKNFAPYLIHGVTGAGKTEIYLELFEKIIFTEKKQGLFLVPEISLTPQLEKRFKKRFGSLVTLYHSQMTARQRTNSWYDFNEGRAKIMLGARSALFCLPQNLGLIILDEEHESSFKQEEKFLYHARDAALKLAQLKNIPIVMGSATPSLESFKNAIEGKFKYIKLEEKVFRQKSPVPEVVNMNKEKPDPFWLSQRLKEAIENNLAQKKQVALFLNRRGWSSMIQCHDCGYTFKCLNCDVSLTLHGNKNLTCHYCGYGMGVPDNCPDCSEEKLYKMGLGTEQVCADLEKCFPTARVLKFDRDEITTKNQLAKAIKSIEDNEVDIVVGTQMIGKGLDFSNLALMGVLDADQALSLPDFRANEKSLQQILQVLGRVGRRENQQAQVIVQTRTPEHALFQNLKEKDFDKFAYQQLEKRKNYNYPPYSTMVALMIKSKTQVSGEAYSQKVADYCRSLKGKWDKYVDLAVLGPCTAPIQKIRNEFRFQILLKFPQKNTHQSFLNEITKALGKPPTHVKLQINVDPVDLM